jgi:hypothetical protein
MNRSAEHWCNDTDRRKWKYSEKTLSQCHNLQNKTVPFSYKLRFKELPACFNLSHFKTQDRRKEARKHFSLLPLRQPCVTSPNCLKKHNSKEERALTRWLLLWRHTQLLFYQASGTIISIQRNKYFSLFSFIKGQVWLLNPHAMLGDRGSTVVKVLRYSRGTAVAQWLRYCATVGGPR